MKFSSVATSFGFATMAIAMPFTNNTAAAMPYTNQTVSVLSVREDKPDPALAKTKLEQLPGAAWAVNCLNDCNKNIGCIGTCVENYGSQGKNNKPDAAAVEKATKGLATVIGLLDCTKNCNHGLICILGCNVKPAPASYTDIPSWPEKIDQAAKTMECAEKCEGAKKKICMLQCI
ncbi:hypothetical protein PFICI_14619 [Pestalotiopsis fici W106-1]|uniref:Uncharacterized protein n=1 Tax=Pestalotiopsis fici (strain W106-1 / CGMCC3.15140) TaxID=1229662 RepID=W3WIG4_PESFW|nr:uncharacterized protein PFICI_14619 [Pestalotiopsis fici W106-1]ETS73673.1 hypothetical protein PFICI_14619 [Pestalotiopsis fici W106-1]